MTIVKAGFIALLSVLSISALLAQNSASSKENVTALRFSVASVRPSNPQTPGAKYELTGDGLVERNNTVLWLIQAAFGKEESRMVIGAPNWAHNDQFDIDARVDDADTAELTKLSPRERGSMLRGILEERFKLQTHFETREIQEYALSVGKGGPRFAAVPVSGEEAKPMWRITGRYDLEAQDASMDQLCYMLLSTEAQQLVVDKTGLNGKYNFKLHWVRQDQEPQTSDTQENEGPSIFTAVREQLGLALVPTKVSLSVVVIDHIEKPASN